MRRSKKRTIKSIIRTKKKSKEVLLLSNDVQSQVLVVSNVDLEKKEVTFSRRKQNDNISRAYYDDSIWNGISIGTYVLLSLPNITQEE